MLFSFISFVILFFFKQKTAYEMRISDWSSDVCSSDLLSMTGAKPVWDMLKAVDPTYTWVEEKSFQARNRKAFEFELLAAPSSLVTLSNTDRPRPLPLPEQEWLLLGTPISPVIVDRSLKPARPKVPDPPSYALHKQGPAEPTKSK